MFYRTTWSLPKSLFAASCLLLIVGLAGVVIVHQSTQAVSDGLNQHVTAVRSSERLVYAIHDVQKSLASFAETNRREHLDVARHSINAVQNELQLGQRNFASTDDFATARMRQTRRERSFDLEQELSRIENELPPFEEEELVILTKGLGV